MTNKLILYPIVTLSSIIITTIPANAKFLEKTAQERDIKTQNLIANDPPNSINDSCTPEFIPRTYKFEITNNTRYLLTYRIDNKPYKLKPEEKKNHIHQYAYYPNKCKFSYVKKPHIRFLKRPHITERQILWGKDSYSFIEKVLDSGDISVDLIVK